MDISNDEMRRQLREIDAYHKGTLKPLEDQIDELFQSEASAQKKWDVLANGANRAKYLKIGGVAVLASAVLAACGSDAEEGAGDTTTTAAGATTTAAGGAKADAMDITVLRFAASVENLAVKAYTDLAPLVKTPAILDAAKLFIAHHTDHAKAFNAAAKSFGGAEVTTPNAAVAADLQPLLAKIKTEQDVVNFAYHLELSAAQTYFSTVGVLKDQKLATTAMSVGGTEMRHAVVLQMAAKATPATDTSLAKGFLSAAKGDGANPSLGALAPKGV